MPGIGKMDGWVIPFLLTQFWDQWRDCWALDIQRFTGNTADRPWGVSDVSDMSRAAPSVWERATWAEGPLSGRAGSGKGVCTAPSRPFSRTHQAGNSRLLSQGEGRGPDWRSANRILGRETCDRGSGGFPLRNALFSGGPAWITACFLGNSTSVSSSVKLGW